MLKDTSTGLANGSLGGGLFNGITPQDGMKLTHPSPSPLPLDSSTTIVQSVRTNNALITCWPPRAVEDVPTAWKHGDSFEESRCR